VIESMILIDAAENRVVGRAAAPEIVIVGACSGPECHPPTPPTPPA
jgi:hypothetical protein